MMLELRINVIGNFDILWLLYCEPAPLSKHRLPLQADILTLIIGYQIFSPSPTYIPAN